MKNGQRVDGWKCWNVYLTWSFRCRVNCLLGDLILRAILLFLLVKNGYLVYALHQTNGRLISLCTKIKVTWNPFAVSEREMITDIGLLVGNDSL